MYLTLLWTSLSEPTLLAYAINIKISLTGIFEQAYDILVLQGLQRLEKYLNLEGFLENSFKI